MNLVDVFRPSEHNKGHVEHGLKFFQNICSITEINANFHISHYNSVETFKLP